MLIPAGFAQINYKFSGPALPRGAEVAFGIENEGLDSPSVLAEMAGGAYNGFLRAQCSNQVTMSGILVKLGPNETGAATEATYGSVGSKIQGDVIPSVALLVRKNTAMGGRHGRGRNYWPVLGDTAIGNGGDIDPAVVADWNGAFASWLDFFEADSHPVVLLHAAAGTPPTPVLSMNVMGKVATQRRRLRK